MSSLSALCCCSLPSRGALRNSVTAFRDDKGEIMTVLYGIVGVIMLLLLVYLTVALLKPELFS